MKGGCVIQPISNSIGVMLREREPRNLWTPSTAALSEVLNKVFSKHFSLLIQSREGIINCDNNSQRLTLR